MITITVTVLALVLVYKSFCKIVCIYGHANKASCCEILKEVFANSFRFLLTSQDMGPLWKMQFRISPGRRMKLCDLVGGNMLKKSTKGCDELLVLRKE